VPASVSWREARTMRRGGAGLASLTRRRGVRDSDQGPAAAVRSLPVTPLRGRMK